MSIKDKLSENSSLTDYLKESNLKVSSNDTIEQINPNNLVTLDKQPFKEYTNTERYKVLKESIQRNGITNPIIVKKNNNEYVILSGRHRTLVAKELGFSTVPCIVKTNITDDDAMTILLDSNLCQRTELLPSEKAWAYRFKNDILKRQGSRSDLANDINKGTKTVELIGNSADISATNVQRYIRLTYLMDNLLDKVDDKRIGFGVGVAISYLDNISQEIINNILDKNNKLKISIKMANELKKLFETNKKLTQVQIESILNLNSSNNDNLDKSLKDFKQIRKKYFSSYFEKDVSDEEVINVIQDALTYYLEK